MITDQAILAGIVQNYARKGDDRSEAESIVLEVADRKLSGLRKEEAEAARRREADWDRLVSLVHSD